MKLKGKFSKEVIPVLQKELNLKNKLAGPKLVKVVLNVGLNVGLKDEHYLTNAAKTLALISGQKPVQTKARQSIAGFKTRAGQVVGLKVTLRGERMYHFVDKLINITLPRVRDFRGLSVKSVDRQGSITIGFREHLAFPEINPDAVDKLHGLEVVVTTSARTYDEGLRLLTLLGFPFKK